MKQVIIVAIIAVAGYFMYANWDKTVFYAEQGVSVWKILDEKIVKSGKKKITVKVSSMKICGMILINFNL